MRFAGLLFTVIVVPLIFIQSTFCQQKTLYIANDEHTDYIWTADAETYRTSFINQLDYYINLMETQNDTILPQFQHRYNCDNSLWVYEYEKAKSANDFQRLIQKIKSGHITVPLTPLAPLYGGQNAEIALRGEYFGGYLERKYGIKIDLAVMMENQTLPLGINSLWAGSGAKYSWKGVCNCVTPDRDYGNRKHQIYYSKGIDGKGVLMKWYNLLGNSQLGTYKELRIVNQAIGQLSSMCNTIKYPYAIAAAFGYGGDDLENYIDFMPATAISQSNDSQKVVVSNERDFFQDFESKYAATIPSQAVTFGNDWDLLIATLAQVSGDVKRSAEKLRAAEAMASLVALKDTAFAQNLAGQRELAWMSVGKYYDHDWTSDGPASAGRPQFQRDMQANFSKYVDTLYNLASAALGNQVKKMGTNTRFYVFNQLGWERSEAVDYPYSGSLPVKVIDLKTQLEVPSQIVLVDNKQYVRILAPAIPSIGYKVFEIQSGAPKAMPAAATFLSGVFENDYYKLTLSENGAVTSFIYKADAGYEYKGSAALNDYGIGTLSEGSFKIENSGPVSVTVSCTSNSPYPHTNFITLYKSVQRVDIDDRLNYKILDTTVTYQFPVNISGPTVWYEEVGAVIKAKLETNGGNYSTQNARYDWQTANHFVYVGNASRGLNISNLGCQFFKLGNSTIDTLDETSNNVQFLAAGKVAFGSLGITDQDGDESFRYQFALQPKTGVFNQTSAMKMSMEHQNPLIAGTVGGGSIYPDSSFSLLKVSQPDVILWSLKPSEEGAAKGIIARAWNQAGNTNITLDGILPVLSAKNTSHIETDISAATIVNGNLEETIGTQEMKTFRVFFKDSSFVRSVTTYTFTGNGNWTEAANWRNSIIPPATLPIGDQIIIDPVANGECILNVLQTIGPGSSLQISASKKLRVLGGLNIAK